MNNILSDTSRFKGRKTYLAQIRDGEVRIQEPKDAVKFFKTLLKYKDDPINFLNQFDDDEENLFVTKALERSILYTEDDFLKPIFEILEVLEKDVFMYALKSKVEELLYKPLFELQNNFILKEMAKRVKEEILEDRHISSVAYFLMKLVNMKGPSGPQVKENKFVQEIVNKLQHCTAKSVRPLMTAFAESNLIPMRDAAEEMRIPGVRDHDNDKENYKEIHIVPTPKELNCDERPFIPEVGKW